MAGRSRSSPIFSIAPLRHAHYNVIHSQGGYMATNALVQARIDGAVKDEASAVLAAMGLTLQTQCVVCPERDAARAAL